MKFFAVMLFFILMIIGKPKSVGVRTISPLIPKDRPYKERCIKTEPTTKTVPPKSVPVKEVE